MTGGPEGLQLRSGGGNACFWYTTTSRTFDRPCLYKYVPVFRRPVKRAASFLFKHLGWEVLLWDAYNIVIKKKKGRKTKKKDTLLSLFQLLLFIFPFHIHI